MYDLKRFRKDKKIKQSEVANSLNVDQSQISRYETGKEATQGMSERLLEIYPELDTYLVKKHQIIESQIGVPFYDVDVFATNSPAMDHIIAMEPEYFIPIPYFREADVAVRVRGDSMYPKYRHGDVIICKRITNKEFILFNEVYLVITRSDNLRTVKYLQEDPDNEDNLLLVPYNSGQHAQAIPKEEILELYKVLGSISET